MAGEAGDPSKSLRSEPMRYGLPNSVDKYGVPSPPAPAVWLRALAQPGTLSCPGLLSRRGHHPQDLPHW